jgi:DNA-binding beta-propeller fold protein YncE
MKRTRNFYVGVTILALVGVLAAVQFMLQPVAEAQANQAGIYQVDAAWPKPLPNNWVLGATVGLSVDSRDHVWIVHRGQTGQDPKFMSQMTFPPAPARGARGAGARGAAPAAPAGRDAAIGEDAATGSKPISEICCTAAPPVLEFDAEGNLVHHWGGPGAGYEWMPSMHGITVDGKDNVWFAGNGGNTVLKFSRDGKFLLQIGKNGASKGNKDTANLNNPAEVNVDDAANEIYVADGYGNRRVIVYDASTGAFKRMWGAYGKPPTDDPNGTYDPSKPLSTNWRIVHCASLANDGLVYVCDRVNDRIQVFKKDGTYVKETQIAKRTLGDGVTFDIAFSKDPQQRLMYVADGANHRVWQLLREPMTVLNHIGSGGRYPGQFYATHNVSLDSKGNIYTVETYTGARLQKFTYKGLGPVANPEGNHNSGN